LACARLVITALGTIASRVVVVTKKRLIGREGFARLGGIALVSIA